LPGFESTNPCSPESFWVQSRGTVGWAHEQAEHLFFLVIVLEIGTGMSNQGKNYPGTENLTLPSAISHLLPGTSWNGRMGLQRKEEDTEGRKKKWALQPGLTLCQPCSYPLPLNSWPSHNSMRYTYTHTHTHTHTHFIHT
jgi:hypothetical protein